MKKQTKNAGRDTETVKKPRPVKLKELALWIEQCDERLEKSMEEIAAEICADGNIKVLRLIGPTCAGKTTAAKKLVIEFSLLGHNTHIVSVDDFYYDKEILHKRCGTRGQFGCHQRALSPM